jgi:hypothetical protein
MDFAVSGTGNDRSASGPDASGPFVFVLKTKSAPSLNGYVFESKEHADRWMAQPFVAEGDYRVEQWEARRSKRCRCGTASAWVLLRRVAALAFVFLAINALGPEHDAYGQQPFRVCSDPRTARLLWSDAAACNEVPMSSYPCDLIANLPHCDPPAVARFRFPVPWDGTVRFAGITTDLGRTYWTWTKAGEPSRPCSPAEAGEQAHYGRGCAARIGDVLFRTPPVYVP